ncbi:MAG: hypothetical protein U9N34_05765, partial [Candidatus Cloacimonadota bacterium]|nr:hypothetical protein [Candidatus Cloacimonadota bacterium]
KFAINLKYTFDMLADTKLQESRNKSGYKQVMGSGRRVMSSSDFSTGDSLDSEIENLKSRREETEKELEKIRKLLEE